MNIRKYLPVCFTGRTVEDDTLSSTPAQTEPRKKSGKRSTGMLTGLISRSRKASEPDLAVRRKPLAEPGSPIKAAGTRESSNSLQQLFDAHLSHVNDGGFWLVKEYFNLTVPQTFQTWTVLETIISIVALLLTLALATVI